MLQARFRKFIRSSVVGGGIGSRTELWRVFSWCVGDEHAHRICKLIDAYCLVAGVDPARIRDGATTLLSRRRS